ncbi:ferredoxin reductase domain-containing protein [Mangrovicoccus algicola]|uniref:Flavodoxin reductase n=1 Tax=Mangrovicoccus algicola TaxID=2771008 RepID=A0A8J7CKF9_9RHOB|nr:flavodoxin reductase [Mangrovicoccus algicola]MBE3638761.1 flavodoxin reductase [Mangrovicoccus algicola]
MTHHVSLQEIEALTGEVWRLRLERPPGYDFIPGEATHVTLDREGWRDEDRPFTFTSQPEDDFLEFTIKSYPDHEGVTAQIPTLRKGEHLRIEDPGGAIRDKGPGVIVAGGAGVTPFIPILRRRIEAGTAGEMTLILADRDWSSLILRDEWHRARDLKTVFVLAEEDREGCESGHVTRALLERHGVTAETRVYLCGPPPMEEAVTEALEQIGVDPEGLVREGN